MMKRTHKLMMLAALPLVVSATALAQSEDTKAILDALKGLGQRMDGMQKQIDELKRPAKAPAEVSNAIEQKEDHPDATASPSQAKPTTPAGMRAEVGWTISALPDAKGQREPDALFRFSKQSLPISFNAHLKTKGIDDWVKYRGEAQLQIYEPGRHVFSVEIAAPATRDLYCGGYLKIGTTVVIDLGNEMSNWNDTTRAPDKETKTVSAGLALETGNYDITFLAACYNRCTVSGNEGCRDAWHGSTFDIQVRGPSDDAPRPFTSKEIIRWVRAKPSVTAVDSAPAKPAKDKPATTGANPAKKPEKELPWTPQQ